MSAVASALPQRFSRRPHRASEHPLGYCSHCGTQLTPALLEGRILGRCVDCGNVAFNNPSVVAVTVLTDAECDGDIWLIRRAIEPFIGRWALPGGYVDASEHPEEAARRECAEEVLCDVRIGKLLGVYNATFESNGVVVIAYSGVISGVPSAGAEVLEVRRFSMANRPRLAFDTHEAAVAQWQALS